MRGVTSQSASQSRFQESGIIRNSLKAMVGAAGFELATPCAQGKCATRLRYAPTDP
jgi:hypothetical protein